MRRILFSIFFLLTVFAYNLHGEIKSSASLIHFEKALEDLKEEALVVFDVDDVLITCCDPTLQEVNKAKLDRVRSAMAQKMPVEEYMRLYSIAMKTREVEVIDPKIYELLSNLSERHIHAVALTHMNTGRFGVIENLEDWRILELDHLGINFKKLSPFSSEEHLKTFSGPTGAYPNIKNGVIFSAEVEKGKILEEALKHLSKKPSEILFIDDRMDNLESVQAFCKENNIPFQGFHYTAIKSRPNKQVDEKLIEIQLDTLMKEERWITSEEAAESFNDAHIDY